MKQESKKSFSFVLFLFSFFILSSFIFYLSSCKRSTEPVYNSQNLQLKVLDVSCTEAWLSLQAKNDYLNKTLKLFKDDKLILEKPLTTEDSLLYVDGLWPNTSYAFKAAVYDGNKLLTRSPAVTATTMDTTSHNFEWQTFEFGGEGGSSSFYDVAIIDENDIWAVGEIYTANDKYNAAHWDGEKWELKKIDWDGVVSRLTCVFAFSSNDVWFGVTNLIHWNGSKFEKNINPVLNQFYYKTVNKIWGTSSSDLYVVGNSGLIAHYDGQQWQRIESGTDLRLLDIFGVICSYNNKKTILTVGANLFHGPETVLLIIGDKKTDRIENPSFTTNLTSLWSSNGLKWFLTGYELFVTKSSFSNKLVKIQEVPNNLKYRIRGSSLNNIFIVGQHGLIWHYNGKRWQNFSDNEGLYYSVAVKENIVVAVGNKPLGFVIGPAIIKIGKRN
ncbi:glucosyl transferase [Calditrichota bacterium LG25]